MHAWTLKKDLIEKNVLSFLGIFSNLRREDISGSFMSSIDPLAKFLSVLLIILSVSISRKLSYVILVDVLLIVNALFLPKKDAKKVLVIALFSLLFAAFIMLPSLFILRSSNALIMVLKITASVLCVNIFVYSTSTNQVARSLKALFLPDILILITEITLKHIITIGDMSVNMLYALKKRTIGERKNGDKLFWGLIGTLFLRSKTMSEDLYSAMRCRGFSGEYKSASSMKLKVIDVAYIVSVLLVISLSVIL